MLKLIRHRPVQACVITALAALVTTCAVLTPLYQRALEQASVVVALRQAPASASQLHLTSLGVLPDFYSRSEDAVPPLSADELERLVPAGLRRSFGRPVPSVTVTAETGPTEPHPSQGRLLWRDGGCDHLRMTAGSCPTGDGQVAVSAEDAANFGWSVGSTIPAVEKLPPGTPGDGAAALLRVTGVYAKSSDPFWDGWALTGVSGTKPDPTGVVHDAWVTAAPTFSGATAWRNPTTQIDLPLKRSAARIDQLLRLGPEASALQRTQSRRPRDVPSVTIRSDLGSVADKVAAGRAQARNAVPFLMLPLGVLGLVVLWMALGAAAEQRRPEVAIVRLRGRGVRGARRYLLREQLTVVLAGVPIGTGVALALAALARDTVLPGSVPLELRFPVWAAIVVSVASVTAAAVLTSVRVSREPLADLLRRVPPRRTGWALSTTDAIALTAAVLIVGAFTTGRLTGPVALVAPAVLALAASLVVARALAPLATRSGRRLLARGRATGAVALLQLARRPGTRAVIALLTVSASLLVFAANAVAVGDRNRRLVAAQAVGAPMVAVVSPGNLVDVLDSVARVPVGTVTPVVVVAPHGNDTQTNLYVDPATFPTIAALPGTARTAIRRLSPPAIAPVRITGDRLDLDVTTNRLVTNGHQVGLALQLLDATGALGTVSLGTLPDGTARRPIGVPVGCAGGCTLTGWRVLTDPASSVRGTVTLTHLRTDRGPVGLGAPTDWAVHGAPASTLQAGPAEAGGLAIAVDNGGRSDLALQHRWVPTTLPAVVSGRLPEGSLHDRFAGTGLDGEDRPMTVAAKIPWLPQSGPDAAVSSLDLASRSGSALTQDAEYQLWFADTHQAALADVTHALAAHHRAVLEVRRESGAVADLEESASAWSLQLGVLVAIACVLVSGLGLVIATAAGWTHRSRDLSVMRLNGLTGAATGRISWAEQLPAIIAGGTAGALTGAFAAHLSLPALPLLPSDPPVDLVDLSLAWSTVLPLAAAALSAVVVLGGVLGWLIARGATVERAVGAP